MNTLKLYEELKKMETIFHNASELSHLNEAYKLLQGLIKDTEADIVTQSNKASGNLTVGKAAIKILEYAAKKSKYETLQKAYRTENSLDICDSYRLVRFNLSTAPTLPEHPAGFDRYPDLTRLVPTAGYNTEVELPSVTDLTTYIKIQKAQLKSKGIKSPVIYTVEAGEHKVLFNAELLLTMLYCLPNAKATIADEYPEHKSMMLKAENGMGMIFPVRGTNI